MAHLAATRSTVVLIVQVVDVEVVVVV